MDKKPEFESLEYELQQAIEHLKNAIAMTAGQKAHLLVSAKSIIKAVAEHD